MRTRDGQRRLTRVSPRRLRAAALLTMVAVGQAGCGREFFREWANQDVSEAVFEKSRDPRWRLDLFTVEPPALARHSNPYDPDRPPAPPDDRATEALSPVPQWPENRLLTPAEGTGYLDMLDAWLRQRPPLVRPAPADAARNFFGFGTPPPIGVPTEPPPPVPGTPSPFIPPGGTSPETVLPNANPPGVLPPNATAPGAQPAVGGPTPAEIPGPAGAPLSPIPGPTPAPDVPPPPPQPPGPGAPPRAPQSRNGPRDSGVTVAAFQQTGLPVPAPPPTAGTPPTTAPPPRDITVPPIGMDPAPNLEGSDLASPVAPPPGQTPREYRAGEALGSQLAGILVPGALTFDEAEAAGIPRSVTPYVISMDQSFTLALINARIYQFNVESIYLASLAVTLQRFAFTPQVYAGLSPVTGVPYPGGTFAASYPDSFNYSTRATGQQSSVLSLGTAAGVGKLFNSGARVLAGFANQVVFNFTGHNSIQPRVQSVLPLSIVQPFLRGGGRAVTLEGLTQAERNLVYALRSFALFRQQFTVATLVGGSVPNFGSAVASLGFTGGASSDPVIGFINLLEDVQIVENDRRNIAAYEQFVTVYRELIKGESSGLSQLQLDQVEAGLFGAKQQIVTDRTVYRSDLDSFKMQMGLPPDTPLVPDRHLTQPFDDVFNAVEEWQRNPSRDLRDLPGFASRLPVLQDVVLDGRSLQGVYSEGNNDEEKLEDTLLAGERLALEHRLDLMNSRAQLYDAWRQIKVTANALQGVLNVGVTNQFVTPSNTTNPFGFVDQARQFSLVLNAELPLVRLNERNNFRAALINFERQRRSLMNNEDSLKLLIRQDIRNVHQQYLNYEIAKRLFVLYIRQKDQAIEQIIAPPQGGAAGGASQAPLQTTNVINFQRSLLGVENQLVSVWYAYQQQRLQLYRDLGTLPIDEWEAFRELFPDEPIRSSGVVPAAARAEGPARVAAARRGAEAGAER